MTKKRMRPVPALGSGSGLGDRFSSAAATNSEFNAPIRSGQDVVDLRAWRLRKRYGLNAATAKLLANHAYGDREADLGSWVSLADAAATAIDSAAQAMEVGP